MRLHTITQSALACTIVALAVTAHAQMAGAAPQIGSTLGGSTGAAATALGKLGSGGVTAVPEDFSRLKIQPGFLLDAQVFDEPDMSGQFRVDPGGNVVLPLVGAVHVAGDTLFEAQDQIQKSLKTGGILKNPQVTLDISEYASTMVTVLGEVSSPGRLQMLAPHSLLDVIAFAGGETQLAGGVVDVRHEQDGKVATSVYHYGRNSDGDTIADVMVHDGDTVIVPRAGIVYVLGQVTRPGGFLMQEDGKLDVAQAISMAMGTTLLASTKHIIIIRRKPDGTFVQFEVSYKDMVRGKIAPPELQSQDIVYIPNSQIKTAFSDVQGIISAAGVAAIYRTLE
jgi:polysaccharide export outer membrane protein